MAELTLAQKVLGNIIGGAVAGWDEPLDEVHDIPLIVNAILADGRFVFMEDV